jgi:hypothetical protein
MSSVQLNIPPMPLPSGDRRAKTAKVAIPKRETESYYAALGGCMDEVRRTFDLTLEGFAYELGTDRAQVGRQIEGKERPQLEKVFAVDRFRAPLVIALAKLATGIQIDTVVTIRRSA